MSGETMNDLQRAEVLRQAVASEDTRKKFTETWAALINEILPTESSVRSIFTVEPLAPGAVPVYPVDVQPLGAWVMPKFGSVPMNIVEVEEITVPTFELVGSAYYKIRDAEQGRINLVDKTMTRLMESMVEQEEDAGWSIIRAAAVARGALTGSGVDPSGSDLLSKIAVDACFAEMESERGYNVTDIYLSSRRLADIRGWTQLTIDPVTQREIFVNAGLPSIYGATLHILHTLDDDEVYFFDLTPEKFGYMPIRKELVTYEDPTAIKELRVGVIAYEEVGFTALDNKCVVKLDLS
jgi:hypothetical protein